LTSRYVVFQFVPNPATDERVNFGVATFGAQGLHARFLSDWQRVRSFGGHDIDFLRTFQRKVEHLAAEQGSLLSDLEGSIQLLFETAPAKWINSIQVTSPRASTRPADQLIDYAAKRFLKARTRQARARDRRWVRSFAYQQVIGALETAGIKKPAKTVRTQEAIEGSIEAQEFDLFVRKQDYVTAALALSFEGQTPRALQREYSSAAWAIEDVRSKTPQLDLAVLMVPPRGGTSKTYEQARHVFAELHVRPVVESDVPTWAEDVAHAVAAGRSLPGSAARA
jgi:hypothetical protein